MSVSRTRLFPDTGVQGCIRSIISALVALASMSCSREIATDSPGGIGAPATVGGPEESLVEGLLHLTDATKGGPGWDPCLGSPYYWIEASGGDQVKLEVGASLDRGRMKAMVGEFVRVQGEFADYVIEPSNEADDGLQHAIPPEGTRIRCQVFKVAAIELGVATGRALEPRDG